jgi:hypothetical protein
MRRTRHVVLLTARPCQILVTNEQRCAKSFHLRKTFLVPVWAGDAD